MYSLRQKIRPKHQVLVFNCYPRHQKNNSELKPNSSELSYLLYYASTRRSKLPKVADFLLKKVESDVYYVRIGNVQVTLQIVKALIEKTPKDLPLYAIAVLNIFKAVLQSHDVTMIEDSVPTFAAFCSHQDPAILAANQEYITQYYDIVKLYASFASKDNPIPNKNAKSIPIRIRFRKAGLHAIKSIAKSDLIAAETERQLSLIVPVILENIYSLDGDYLSQLEETSEQKAELGREAAFKRRTSTIIPTRDSVETADTTAAASAGSIEAADAIAEKETATLALQALELIFAAVPQSQLRIATAQVLKFMADRISHQEHFPDSAHIPLQSASWPCRLMGLICAWAPVGDRHGILVTAIEELVHTPFKEDTYEKNYVLATIVGWLLSSEINFIGLSVMDVLTGIIQHILTLLQYPSQPNSPNQEDFDKDDNPNIEHERFESNLPSVITKAQLLTQLQRCIGCLSVHIYYSDQVSDMISALLSRLKPSPSSSSTSTTPITAENGNATTSSAAASTTSLNKGPSAENYFYASKAKIVALEAIKEILIWANWIKPDGISTSLARHHVNVDRWEGTQWLLRDDSWGVRVAYVEVLLEWMKTELRKPNLRVLERSHRSFSKKDKERKDSTPKEGSLAKRAVSNASHRDLSPSPSNFTFLPLLHLTIYDNAIQRAASSHDILLLHLLLSNLVERLGVNSTQHGLPMIKRLQDDAKDLEDSASKINIGSLVHGYLWGLSTYFHFDASVTGRKISDEISSRSQKGAWFHSIKIPPITLKEIVQKRNNEEFAEEEEEGENDENDHEEDQFPPSNEIILEPFEDFNILVDKVAQGYEITIYSPPSSPPTSPVRKFNSPLLDQSLSRASVVANKLPESSRELMLNEWSREDVIQTNSHKESSRSGSLNGTNPTIGSGKHLSVAITPFSANINGDLSPSPRRSVAPSLINTKNSRPVSAAQGARDAQYHHGLRESLFITANSAGRARVGGTCSPHSVNSSGRGAVRVEDLKRVLSGAAPSTTSTGPAIEQADDSASESMVSYEGSELSVPAPVSRPDHNANGINDIHAQTEGSITPRPLTANSTISGKASSRSRSNSSPEPELEEDDIPPVPPVPQTYTMPPQSSVIGQAVTTSLLKPSPPQSPKQTRGSSKSKSPHMIPSASKTDTINSATVRENLRRSISTRDGVTNLLPSLSNSDEIPVPELRQKSSWNALDLLDSIGADVASPPPGSSTNKPFGSRNHPPY